MTAGIHACDLYRVFVGVGAAVCEKHLCHIIGHKVDDHFCQSASRLAGIGRSHITVFFRLLLYGLDYLTVFMTHIKVYKLA